MEIEERDYSEKYANRNDVKNEFGTENHDFLELFADKKETIDTLRQNEWKITLIKDKLFDTANSLDKDVLLESIKALHSNLDCTECSLWSINHNSTQGNNTMSSASLICRECTVEYDFSNHTDYVHDLSKGLFYNVIGDAQTDTRVYIFSREEAKGHRSKDFVDKAELTKFIVFPIFEKDTQSIIALLEISYKKCDWDDGFWDDLSKVICPFFSVAFTRNSLAQKQSLMETMISIHREHKNNEVGGVLGNIIEGILKEVCPAQGASFYMWDLYQNRYNLTAFIGIESDSELLRGFYKMGEGTIGRIAQTGKPLIIDFVKQEKSLGLYRVQWNNPVNSEMYIPVMDPSDENEMLGVLKVVNKTNEQNNSIIDYFNDADVEIMLYAANYLALVISNNQKEERQYNLIDKLTHEILTPANAISKTANRLYTHLGNQVFFSKYLSPYLKNIIDFAELQRWQAKTNLYLTKNRRNTSFNDLYTIRPVYFYKIVKESIEIARPIARKYDAKFENIRIDPSVDQQLTVKIDKVAFVTLFYNLFTNAIKYKDPKATWEQFYIGVVYKIEVDSLIIEVADNGIGIDENEKDAIFGVGYRSNSAMRINSSGYGIGLTVVMQIVKDFGGKIDITSFKKPTVFQITIPKQRIQ